MATKYNFRILIETEKGKKYSYISQSIFNSDVDTNYVISSSDMWNRITHSISCSYHNSFHFTGSFQSSNIKRFKDNPYLSSSVTGSEHSGSISFLYKGLNKSATNSAEFTPNDKLKRFKFFGNKICSVLNLTEDYWYRPERFLLTKPVNYFAGDVDGRNVNINGNLKMGNFSSLNSHLTLKHDHSTPRFIKWLNITQSKLPHNDLLIGYNDVTNTYMISHSSNMDPPSKFVIDGVTSLNTTAVTSSYNTVVNYTSSGDMTVDGNTFLGEDDEEKMLSIGRRNAMNPYAYIQAGIGDQNYAVGYKFFGRDRFGSQTEILKISSSGQTGVNYVGDFELGTAIGVDKVNLTVDGNISGSLTASFGGIVNVRGTDPRLKIKAIGANHPGIELYEDSTRKWVLFNKPSNDKFVIKNDTTELVKINQAGGTELTNITASGNISSSSDLYAGNIWSRGPNKNLSFIREDGNIQNGIQWFTDGTDGNDTDAKIYMDSSENLLIQTLNDGGHIRINPDAESGGTTPGGLLIVEGSLSASNAIYGQIGTGVIISGSKSDTTLLTVTHPETGSLITVAVNEESDNTGSLLVSGSVELKSNNHIPSVSGSKLYNNYGHLYWDTALMGDYHPSGSTTSDGIIKIMPGDCVVNDDVVFDGGPFAQDNGYALQTGDNNQEMYCYKDIPYGWKATGFRTYGSQPRTTTFYSYEITDTTATADGTTGLMNGPEKTLSTPIASTATNYVGIHVAITSTGDLFYGGYIKIERL